MQGRGGGTGGQGDLLCALQMQRAALRSFARLHLLPNKQEENPSIEPAAKANAKKIFVHIIDSELGECKIENLVVE